MRKVKDKPREYLTAEQKTGDSLIAESVYLEIVDWLKSRGSAGTIPKTLIEQFAMTSSRFAYCEDQLSKHGLLSRNPATGEPMPNPYHKMALDYCKQANQLWSQIKSVADNLHAVNRADNPADAMEQILRRVK